MPEYGLQIPWVAAPLVALVLVVWNRKWRWLGALVLGCVGVAIGVWKGVIVPSDAINSHADSGLDIVLLQLLAWTVFAMLARANGRLPIRGAPIFIAPLMGALLGELAAAALLSAAAKDRSAAARLALAAAGGGMIGRVGDPAMLTIWAHGVDWVFLGLLGIGWVAIAAPRADDLECTNDTDRWLLGAGVVVALTAVFSPWAIEGLLLGSTVLAVRLRGRFREVDWRPMGWLIGSSLLVMVALFGGTTALGGLGLSELQGFWGERVRMVMTGGGAVLASMVGGQGASLMAEAVLGRSGAAALPYAGTATAAGLAVGGLSPLVIAGALKEGWRRWFLQVALVLILCGVFLN